MAIYSSSDPLLFLYDRRSKNDVYAGQSSQQNSEAVGEHLTRAVYIETSCSEPTILGGWRRGGARRWRFRIVDKSNRRRR